MTDRKNCFQIWNRKRKITKVIAYKKKQPFNVQSKYPFKIFCDKFVKNRMNCQGVKVFLTSLIESAGQVLME